MKYRYREDIEMKDSGIEWLGKIPKGWNIRHLKRVLADRKENNDPIKTNFILSLTIEKGVIPYSEKGVGGNKAKDDLSKYKLVYPNDIVLNSMNVIVGAVGLSKYFGCASPAYYMLYKINNYDDIRYYNYIFQSKLFQDNLKGLGNGIMMKQSETSGKLNTIRMRIPMDKLGIVKLPIISNREQEKIANFLDEKTSQFESIISKKEDLIKKLEEAKKSLISEIVTGKVKVIKNNDGYELVKRSSDDMKPSGVEWLGMIPKEWNITKLKLKTSQINRGKSPEYVEESCVKVINQACIYWDNFKFDNVKYQDDSIKSERGKVYKNDILINSTGTGTLGRANIFEENGEYIVDSHVTIVRCLDSNYAKYLRYVLRTDIYQELIYSTMVTGSTNQIELSREGMRNMVVLNFDDLELCYINELLELKIQDINNTIYKTKLQIEKLKEAKQSLISEAVTGKIEILD
ncbi:restriction endonuclease subunit S [Paraclostridium sordellii]|uniref:restriction endonuclease subunit S n=1 Tax=Paraclostridium sordellii TaxID=1505 RepID=UPI0005E7818F|nr:hypothetical protein [Paeniclostridium sordellii]CEN77901.1 restriction modification system DNA specificity domain-containing protein [[Clostridium] sordellii] [Paeniclostridium sordellii]